MYYFTQFVCMIPYLMCFFSAKRKGQYQREGQRWMVLLVARQARLPIRYGNQLSILHSFAELGLEGGT